jgi:hypothetical protein
VTAGWVAATMRGQALLRGAAGIAGARAIASTASWDPARELLARTIAGRSLAADADRAGARDATVSATVWQLRVLAGWLPPTSTGLVRLAAGPIEIGNVERHIEMLDGGPRRTTVALGSLATAWPRVAASTSTDAVREALRRSVWGDPGGTDRVTVGVGLRVAWLRRVQRVAPAAASWATGAMAVVTARERFAFGREIAAVTGHEIDRTLGRQWRAADSLGAMFDRLPPSSRWPLVGVDRPEDLWRSERAVLQRVTTEAGARAASGGRDRATLVAILALLLVDLWRVLVAIDLAGRDESGREMFDAVAA